MNSALVFPMFAMFLLSVFVLVKMFLSRVDAIRSGQLSMKYFKILDQGTPPEKMVQASRQFSNLFETPILFYVVCILGIIFSAGTIFTVFAWLYFVSRVVHAYIHMGYNKVRHRMLAFAFSWVCLIAMWVLIVIQIV